MVTFLRSQVFLLSIPEEFLSSKAFISCTLNDFHIDFHVMLKIQKNWPKINFFSNFKVTIEAYYVVEGVGRVAGQYMICLANITWLHSVFSGVLVCTFTNLVSCVHTGYNNVQLQANTSQHVSSFCTYIQNITNFFTENWIFFIVLSEKCGKKVTMLKLYSFICSTLLKISKFLIH